MPRKKKVDPLTNKMTEAQLQSAIIQCAHLHGWKVAHFRAAKMQSGRWATPVQADGKGFPDLVLANPDYGPPVFVELKSAKGVLSDAQKEWLELVDGMVWRPSDWLNGSVEAFLDSGEEKAEWFNIYRKKPEEKKEDEVRLTNYYTGEF